MAIRNGSTQNGRFSGLLYEDVCNNSQLPSTSSGTTSVTATVTEAGQILEILQHKWAFVTGKRLYILSG